MSAFVDPDAGLLAESPVLADLTEPVMTLAADHRERTGTPVVGVGVVVDGQVVACRTVTAGGAPVAGQRCTFALASNSKLLVMAAVLSAAQRGAFELDDPVNVHLRRIRVEPPAPDTTAITIRHLLTHTAGLAAWRRRSDLLRWGSGEILRAGQRRPDLPEFYGGRLRGVVAPGSMFLYSDHAYAILGQLIADVDDRPMAEVVRAAVLEPLGMRGSGFPPFPEGVGPAQPGHRFDGTRETGLREVLLAPGAAVASVADMTRFVWALSHGGAHPWGRMLTAETTSEIFRPAYRLHPSFPAFGMQFILCGDRPVVGVMRGGYRGSVSWVAACPELRLGIVLLGNKQVSLDRLGRDIITTVTGRADVALLDAAVSPELLAREAETGMVRAEAAVAGVFMPMPKQGFLDYLGGELLLRVDHGRLRLRRIWRKRELPLTDPLVPVPGVVDMYLMHLPWATVPVWLRRDAGGRVAEVCVSPFDRFQRVRPAEVMTLPARRVVSAGMGALTWLGGLLNWRRR